MISIIIPAYNASATLSRCLDSIRNQSYKDFEAIVVDDGSSDDTYSIIKSYAKADSRIVPIHKSNGGVSSARNLALDNAKGEYIAFCDADDEVLPDWLKDFADNMSQSDLVLQDIKYVYTGGCRICTLNTEYNLIDCQQLIMALHDAKAVGFLFTKLLKRSIISQYNIKFKEDIHFREDEIFFLQYMEHAKICTYVSKTNYIYYLPSGNKTYKSAATRATDLIFCSLNRIYNNNIPTVICRRQAWSVKGACVERLLNGEKLSNEIISIYRQVFTKTLQGEINPLLNWIILNSRRLGKVSNIVLRLIHKSLR